MIKELFILYFHYQESSLKAYIYKVEIDLSLSPRAITLLQHPPYNESAGRKCAKVNKSDIIQINDSKKG